MYHITCNWLRPITVTNKKAKRHDQIVKADNQNGKAAEKGNYNTNVFDLSALVSRAQHQAKEIANQLPLEHERPIQLDTLLDVGERGQLRELLLQNWGLR